jgi:hypothetical protein
MNYLNELISWLNTMDKYLKFDDKSGKHKIIIDEIEKRIKELQPILVAQDEEDDEV